MNTRSNQPSNMRNIRQTISPNLPSNISKRLKINNPWISRSTANNHLRPFPQSNLPNLFHINKSRLLLNTIRNKIISLPRKINLRPVRQMSTMTQIHPKNLIPSFQHSKINRHIRRTPRIRLHIHMLRPKQFLSPLNRQPLNLITKLIPLIIPTPRITLCILIIKNRTTRRQNILRTKILRRYHIQSRLLSIQLISHNLIHFLIRNPKTHTRPSPRSVFSSALSRPSSSSE